MEVVPTAATSVFSSSSEVDATQVPKRTRKVVDIVLVDDQLDLLLVRRMEHDRLHSPPDMCIVVELDRDREGSPKLLHYQRHRADFQLEWRMYHNGLLVCVEANVSKDGKRIPTLSRAETPFPTFLMGTVLPGKTREQTWCAVAQKVCHRIRPPLADDDIILLSTADEIPSAACIQHLRRHGLSFSSSSSSSSSLSSDFMALRYPVYCYDWAWKAKTDEVATVAATWGAIKMYEVSSLYSRARVATLASFDENKERKEEKEKQKNKVEQQSGNDSSLAQPLGWKCLEMDREDDDLAEPLMAKGRCQRFHPQTGEPLVQLDLYPSRQGSFPLLSPHLPRGFYVMKLTSLRKRTHPDFYLLPRNMVGSPLRVGDEKYTTTTTTTTKAVAIPLPEVSHHGGGHRVSTMFSSSSSLSSTPTTTIPTSTISSTSSYSSSPSIPLPHREGKTEIVASTVTATDNGPPGPLGVPYMDVTL